MPVEIREIVIQAKVSDKSGAEGSGYSSNTAQLTLEDTEVDATDKEPDMNEALVQKVVDHCLREMKAWLNEKSIR
jgi:hypothetical protein